MNIDFFEFEKLLASKGYRLKSSQYELLEIYYQQLIEWNEKMNLTAITDKDQVFIKHFYDSWALSLHIPLERVQSLADIGSGAGFPSLPLKIFYPHLKITIVDSLNKRIQFLNHLVNQLGLEHVECIHARAEDAGRLPMHRDAYDLVTARAVARLHVLNELCLPFVQKGGYFAASKGADPSIEVEEAKFSASELRASLESQQEYVLPMDQAQRHIIVYKKNDVTPKKYPRKAGLPNKSPLM